MLRNESEDLLRTLIDDAFTDAGERTLRNGTVIHANSCHAAIDRLARTHDLPDYTPRMLELVAKVSELEKKIELAKVVLR